jgi:hypothetical protein
VHFWEFCRAVATLDLSWRAGLPVKFGDLGNGRFRSERLCTIVGMAMDAFTPQHCSLFAIMLRLLSMRSSAMRTATKLTTSRGMSSTAPTPVASNDIIGIDLGTTCVSFSPLESWSIIL